MNLEATLFNTGQLHNTGTLRTVPMDSIDTQTYFLVKKVYIRDAAWLATLPNTTHVNRAQYVCQRHRVPSTKFYILSDHHMIRRDQSARTSGTRNSPLAYRNLGWVIEKPRQRMKTSDILGWIWFQRRVGVQQCIRDGEEKRASGNI